MPNLSKASYANFIKLGKSSNQIQEDKTNNLEMESNEKTDFYVLTCLEELNNREIPDYGWKFHLGVNDEELWDENKENNIAHAWNIVKDILIKYRIYEAKVIKLNKNLAKTRFKDSQAKEINQSGKQITIYASKDARADDAAF